MTLRNLPVSVRGGGKHQMLLDCALVIARYVHAHVEVVGCRPRSEDMMPFGVVVSDSMRRQLALSADDRSR